MKPAMRGEDAVAQAKVVQIVDPFDKFGTMTSCAVLGILLTPNEMRDNEREGL